MIGTLLAFLLVALLPVYANAASCTDGTDCYCDLISDAQLATCEDWENPAWYEDGFSPDWATAPPGDAGFRGGAGIWQTTYGPAGGNCSWRLGEPSSPPIGLSCAYNACAAAAEWRADNRFSGNSRTCIDIQRSGDVNGEVSGLTLSGGGSGEVFDGNSHFAHRVRPGATSALASVIAGSFDSEMGMTFARAYSTNLFSANPDANNGNWLTTPWKGDQTSGGLQFPEGNTGSNVNNPPFSGGTVDVISQSACEASVAGANLLIGGIHCQGNVFRHGAAKPGDCDSNPNCDSSNEFNRSRDWPLGTWGCVRAYWGGMGTSSAELYIDFQGPSDAAPRRIFHVTNLDAAQIWGSGHRIGNYVFDAYYNGNSDGPPNIETFYRYVDNYHLRHGEPVSCSQIGFDFGPTPTPTVSPTTGPTGTPTVSPTTSPSPTVSPTAGPTGTPTASPTTSPSPTASPTSAPGALFWFTDFEDGAASNCDGDGGAYYDAGCPAGNYDEQYATSPAPISGNYSGRAYGGSNTYAHVDAAAAGHTDVYMDFEITVASHTSSTDRRVMNISTDAGNWHCSLSLSHTGAGTFTAKVQSSAVTASGVSDSLSDDTVYQVRLVVDKVDDDAPDGHFDCTLYIDSDGDFGNGDLNGGGKTHSATAYPTADQDASGFWHASHITGAWDSDIDDIGLCDLPATPGVRCVVYQPTASPTVSPTTSPSPTVSPTAAPTPTPGGQRRLLIIGRNN